jgi:thymidylate synthase (FAD)
MKIITEPTVEIVAATQFFESKTFLIPDDGTDAEKLGAFSAKVCYDSAGKGGRPNIVNQERVISEMHGSVLEHATVSLYITGITRGLSLELNRHRPFAVSQRSTRYTKEEDSAIVLEPYYASIWNKYNYPSLVPNNACKWTPGYLMNVEGSDDDVKYNEMNVLSKLLRDSANAIDSYKSQVYMLEQLNPNKLEGFDLRKWARGKARNVLPHGLETRGTWTMNYRALRWFIEARSNRHAEPEIRVLADVVLTTVRPLAPTYFNDFELSAVIDGIPEWTPRHHKV